MTTLYKAVRPDGTDFWTGTIQWAPPVGHEGEWIVRHPNGEREPGTHPYTFLSVSDAPTDCSGMKWPCRLLTVEPVEGYPTARPGQWYFPHRVAAMAWRVTGERPAHEALGPQGEHVARLLDSLADAPWDTVRDAAWVAAGDAIRGAARKAAWYAASDATREAVWEVVWDADWYAWEEAWDAAVALVVRDLIPRETYDVLTRSARLAGITVHPDDPNLEVN